MSGITDIQEAILGLPQDDYVELRRWFHELDWEEWDRRIESDSDDGKLDFLIDEAEEAKEQSRLQEL